MITTTGSQEKGMVETERNQRASFARGTAPEVQTSAPDDPALNPSIEAPILEIDRINLWYGQKQALKDNSLRIGKNKITAFIGPSGCGKSTLLRCINRLNDLIDIVRIEGEIRFEGRNIYDPEVEINALRKRIGMVFQKSNPFPK